MPKKAAAEGELVPPKRPPTGYFAFCEERRSDLREKHKNLKITEISKLLSEEWKKVSDDKKKVSF